MPRVTASVLAKLRISASTSAAILNLEDKSSAKVEAVLSHSGAPHTTELKRAQYQAAIALTNEELATLDATNAVGAAPT